MSQCYGHVTRGRLVVLNSYLIWICIMLLLVNMVICNCCWEAIVPNILIMVSVYFEKMIERWSWYGTWIIWWNAWVFIIFRCKRIFLNIHDKWNVLFEMTRCIVYWWWMMFGFWKLLVFENVDVMPFCLYACLFTLIIC